MGRHQELIGSGPVLAVLWLNILGSNFKVLIALAVVSQGMGESAARLEAAGGGGKRGTRWPGESGSFPITV